MEVKLSTLTKTRLIISIGFLSSITLGLIIGWWMRGNYIPQDNAPLVEKIVTKPLESYSIENLAASPYQAGKLEFKETADLQTPSPIDDKPMYKSELFNFKFLPKPNTKEEKSTSVLINTPIKADEPNKKYPLVLMIRGYVDPSIYSPGVGTKRAGEVFVKNGFITVAPDFLGYAESDINSSNIFESRFQTYTTVLSLLNSLDQVESWDKTNIFIWAHSNGGQIALTTLEISGKNIPTTLWAPVSKPFPYSILYYTDESEDKGKLIRRELAKFEDLYDTDKYSLDNYFNLIGRDLSDVAKTKLQIQLHQGTADDAIPVEWSKQLSRSLETAPYTEVTYWEYPGSDHNLQPAWDTVVQRDLEFFKKNLLSL